MFNVFVPTHVYKAQISAWKRCYNKIDDHLHLTMIAPDVPPRRGSLYWNWTRRDPSVVLKSGCNYNLGLTAGNTSDITPVIICVFVYVEYHQVPELQDYHLVAQEGSSMVKRKESFSLSLQDDARPSFSIPCTLHQHLIHPAKDLGWTKLSERHAHFDLNSRSLRSKPR